MNVIPTIISTGLSLLIAYAFYAYGITGNNGLIGIVSFITIAGCLFSMFGTKYNSHFKSINSRTLSVMFFLAFIAIHIFFSFICFDRPIYIIVTGITALLYLLSIYYALRGQGSNLIK